MKSAWDPRDGFEALEVKMDNGIVNAAFAKRPLSDSDVMQKALYNILETGQFTEEMKQWYTLKKEEQTSWIFGKDWWRKKYALHKKLNKSAGGFQYGQNVMDDVDAGYNTAVDSFAEAHNATQGAINNLTSGIPAIQQQMQQQAMMMQQMAQQNQQLQQMLLAQQYNNNNNRNIINNNNNNNRRRNNNNNRGNNSNNQGFGSNNRNFNNSNFGNFNNSNSNTIMGAGWDAGSKKFNRNNWPANVYTHTKPEYCWTHGCDAAHSSQNCPKPAP